MDFANKTPFAALAFDVVDPNDEESPLVVARATFDLRPPPPGRVTADPDEVETLVAAEPAEQPKLVLTDEYFGETNRSSVRQESDLAPGKPRCDVIVIGSAWSPTGAPVKEIEVAVRVRRTADLPPLAEAGTRLDHRLVVRGPRWFVRRGERFDLGDPEPFTSQAIRFEHAFGGELRVHEGDDAASKLRAEDRLPDEVRAKHPEGAAAPIAHTICEQNPVGTGYLAKWYADAASVDRWPAPRVEARDAPITAEIFERMVRGELRPGEVPELSPRGLGAIAKPWLPRRSKAGTFDQAWLDARWPKMPEDHDLAFWNAAHPDMQCDPLLGGEIVELWNLLPPGDPGASATRDGRTVCRFRLPDPVVAARIRHRDGEGWGVPRVDTLVIDLEARTVAMVWRLLIPAALDPSAAALVTLAGKSLAV